MAHVYKKPNKRRSLTHEEQVEQDAKVLAQLIYDIYQDNKLKEQKNEIS